MTNTWQDFCEMGIMVTIFTYREVRIWRLNNMLQITKLVIDNHNIPFAALWLSSQYEVQAQKKLVLGQIISMYLGVIFILKLFANAVIQLSPNYNMFNLVMF